MISILSELEQDALLEVLNLGMGQAADALSGMVAEEILLSVPRLYFLPWEEAAEMIGPGPTTRMSAVRQRFTGPFHGSTMLIYPRERSLELVRALLREEIPLEECQELEQESLTEVGNILLNACLGSLANIMGVEILCDLPAFLQGTRDALLASERALNADNGIVLLLFIDFTTKEETVKGHVVLLFDAWSISRLKRELAAVIRRFEGP
ncbi:MAG: chemotaxis protein CheC [Magnetococcales bacterium]|nr:chemotaxis protein CheC [Magnetococcales bacterium]NGZ05538.1 chemotaxis protein CheC [Magnetococcales bacterium]